MCQLNTECTLSFPREMERGEAILDIKSTSMWRDKTSFYIRGPLYNFFLVQTAHSGQMHLGLGHGIPPVSHLVVDNKRTFFIRSGDHKHRGTGWQPPPPSPHTITDHMEMALLN